MSYRIARAGTRASAPPASAWDHVEHAQRSVPVNLSHLAEQLRLRVLRAKLEDPVTGLLNQEADQSYTIFVNQRLAVPRQRFTIAHQMGHFLLHYERLGYGTIDLKSGKQSRKTPLFNAALTAQDEQLADQFAMALLMPADAVRSCYRRRGKRPSAASLAKTFAVTRRAMAQRLAHLQRVGYL